MSAHIEHIEDLILQGRTGALRAFRNFQDLSTVLTQGSSPHLSVSLKWDGAPSVVCGTDPSGKFFVATKGFFNKTPRVYYTREDIVSCPKIANEVKQILICLLLKSSGLGEFNGILQGDVMFTRNTMLDEVVDGVGMLTFQENTIVYGVPNDCALARALDDMDMGIFFHTTYAPESFGKSDRVSRVPGADLKWKGFLSRGKVWVETCSLFTTSPRPVGYGVMESYYKDLRVFEAVLGKDVNPFLNELEQNTPLREAFSRFSNAVVKGDAILLPGGFVTWNNARTKEHIDTLTTERGKEAALERSLKMNALVLSYKETVCKIFAAYTAAARMKRVVVNTLDQRSPYKTFYRQRDGKLVGTSHEGYVVYDRRSLHPVKIVDREEFSRLNFSDDVQKAWTKTTANA